MTNNSDNQNIIHTELVAHVIFTIKRVDDRYLVTSETKNKGKQFIIEKEDEQAAWDALAHEKEQLEKKIEYLRKGKPTPQQLFFLFDKNISIPLTLTWGEASDIIDERLSQIEREKSEKQAKLFKGFAVGMKVTHSFTVAGKKHTYRGEITKLTSNNNGGNYAHIKLDGSSSTSKLSIDTLAREREITSCMFQIGDKVSHSLFGEGLVLSSEMGAGTEFVEVQFGGRHGKKRLSTDFAKLDKLPQ